MLNRAAKENDAEQAGKEEWSATHEGGPSSAGNESDITSSDSEWAWLQCGDDGRSAAGRACAERHRTEAASMPGLAAEQLREGSQNAILTICRM